MPREEVEYLLPLAPSKVPHSHWCSMSSRPFKKGWSRSDLGGREEMFQGEGGRAEKAENIVSALVSSN